MASEKYVTLDQLDPEICDWQFPLPPNVEPSQLEINVKRLRALKYLSGVALLTVTAHQGETSQVTPAASGVNLGGTLNAAASGAIVRAKRNRLSSEVIGPDHGPNFSRTAQVISINKSEMASIIASRQQHQKDLGPARIWAAELDRELRYGFRSIINKELTDRGQLFNYVFLGLAAYIATINFLTRPVPEAVAEVVKTTTMFVAGEWGGKVARGGREMLRMRLPSVLPGVQLDRYAVIAGMSAVPRLIRTVPEAKK